MNLMAGFIEIAHKIQISLSISIDKQFERRSEIKEE